MDSINYAQRIQQAILPPDELKTNILPESFVLFMPKDIVSGDFYWMYERNNRSYFTAADCTGHGVPGAMVLSSLMPDATALKSLKCAHTLKPAVRKR